MTIKSEEQKNLTFLLLLHNHYAADSTKIFLKSLKNQVPRDALFKVWRILSNFYRIRIRNTALQF